MKTLLEKTRQINELLQQKNTFNLASDLPYDKMVTYSIAMLILSVVTVVCWDSLRRMMSTMNVSKRCL